MPRRPLLAGALFQALSRTRHNIIQAELSARGLQNLGAPLILFILRDLGQEGELSAQRELADILRVSPATIAVSLKSLQRMGMVERRPDSRDQRRKRIALTPKGVHAVDTCLDVFCRVDQQMLQGFSQEEQQQLIAYHRRMLKNLGGEEPPPFCHR